MAIVRTGPPGPARAWRVRMRAPPSCGGSSPRAQHTVPSGGGGDGEKSFSPRPPAAAATLCWPSRVRGGLRLCPPRPGLPPPTSQPRGGGAEGQRAVSGRRRACGGPRRRPHRARRRTTRRRLGVGASTHPPPASLVAVVVVSGYATTTPLVPLRGGAGWVVHPPPDPTPLSVLPALSRLDAAVPGAAAARRQHRPPPPSPSHALRRLAWHAYTPPRVAPVTSLKPPSSIPHTPPVPLAAAAVGCRG